MMENLTVRQCVVKTYVYFFFLGSHLLESMSETVGNVIAVRTARVTLATHCCVVHQ